MSDQVLKILFEWGWIIVLLLIGAGYVLWILKTKGKEAALTELRQMAFQLMLVAEKKFPGEDGGVKMRWVIDRFWPALPSTFKFLVSKDEAQVYLQALYDEIKDFLDDGEFNDSNVLSQGP